MRFLREMKVINLQDKERNEDIYTHTHTHTHTHTLNLKKTTSHQGISKEM